jgi:hypothetical protein
MTEYMQLRQSDLSALADADETVTYVAYALFCAWFPWHRTSGPVGEGVWLEGKQYRRAPDGHILIDMDGYEKWVERAMA